MFCFSFYPSIRFFLLFFFPSFLTLIPPSSNSFFFLASFSNLLFFLSILHYLPLFCHCSSFSFHKFDGIFIVGFCHFSPFFPSFFRCLFCVFNTSLTSAFMCLTELCTKELFSCLCARVSSDYLHQRPVLTFLFTHLWGGGRTSLFKQFVVGLETPTSLSVSCQIRFIYILLLFLLRRIHSFHSQEFGFLFF